MMKFSMHVGLGLGHIVLDGTQLPSPKGAEPPIFGQYNLCVRYREKGALAEQLLKRFVFILVSLFFYKKMIFLHEFT